MNAGSSKRIVVGSLVITGVMASGNNVLEGKLPPLRILWGVAGAGVALGFLSDAAPGLAVGLAIVLMTSTAFVAGAPFWQAITKTIDRKATP